MRRAAGVALVFGPIAALSWWWVRASNPLDVVRIILAVFVAGVFVGCVLIGIALLLPDDE